VEGKGKYDELLIEPVWNRNERRKYAITAENILLIEPVWNRNCRRMDRCYEWRPAPFNRTSLESKLSPMMVLQIKRQPFNRTSLESKQTQRSDTSAESHRF